MSRYLPVDDPGALDAAEAILLAGEPIVAPTDTVYGLAALPSSIHALYAMKGRPDALPIAVLVESLEQAVSLVAVSATAERLAHAFWPGPLTIVLPSRTGSETVGVRSPDHAFIRALARRVGPLAVTSANRHGQPTPAEARDAAAALTGDIALVVDGGPCHGTASTVIDATADELIVIRTGPISEEQIRAVALR